MGVGAVAVYQVPQLPQFNNLFWLSLQRHVKYVRNLLSVTAYGDHCVLATKADETMGQVVSVFTLALHNAFKTPLVPYARNCAGIEIWP